VVGQHRQRSGSQPLEWLGRNPQHEWVNPTGISCQNHKRLQQGVMLFDSYRQTCRPISLPAWLRRSRSELLKQYCVNLLARKVSRVLARSGRYRFGKLER